MSQTDRDRQTHRDKERQKTGVTNQTLLSLFDDPIRNAMDKVTPLLEPAAVLGQSVDEVIANKGVPVSAPPCKTARYINQLENLQTKK